MLTKINILKNKKIKELKTSFGKIWLKIFLLLILNIFFSTQIFAINLWEWETLFKSNIRTAPSAKNSTILFVSKNKEKFKIIKKIDGWYKIETHKWEAWIWDQAIKVKNKYTLTKADNLIVKKFTKAIENIIKKNWEKSRKIFIKKLKEISKKNNDLKFSTILNQIVFNLEEPIRKIEEEKKKKNAEKKLQEQKKIETEKIEKLETNDVINYDLEKIKKTWIWWHNIERKKLGLAEYSEEEKLNISATNWSITKRNKKIMDHKRSPNDSYYDYWKINTWFKNNWVVCKNIYRVTHSESIGRAWISCNKDDCTDEIIKGIRWTFDYFMSEKWISWIAGAHYRAIVHKTFKQIWFWLAVEKNWKNSYRIYHTTHYCTEVQ